MNLLSVFTRSDSDIAELKCAIMTVFDIYLSWTVLLRVLNGHPDDLLDSV